MTNKNRKFNTGLIIALTASLATIAQPQPASAQILEIVSGALGGLLKSKQPQPQIIQQKVPVPVPAAPSKPDFNLGTNNANGNTLHLCISNCLPPGSAPAPIIRAPQAAPQIVQQPPIIQQRPVIQQQPVIQQSPVAQQQTSRTIVQQNGAVNGTSQISQQSSSQSATAQNIPSRPNVNIPATNLPINLPR
ncbi:MAG: hypothetical protein AAFW67_04145 [Cyanobacteria bacterium J06638_38]